MAYGDKVYFHQRNGYRLPNTDNRQYDRSP